MQLMEYQISILWVQYAVAGIPVCLWSPHAVADIPDFIYVHQMQLQTYQIPFKGSKYHNESDGIPDFNYGLQMQLQTYQISFIGSKYSWRNTRFHLRAPTAVADIPDFIYGLLIPDSGLTWFHLWAPNAVEDIPDFIYELQIPVRAPNGQTYHNTIYKFRAPNACDEIPDFNYGLQMQLQTYQISFMGSKCSWRTDRFYL